MIFSSKKYCTKYMAENIKVGKNVAAIGFPMGIDTLTAPGIYIKLLLSKQE